jgi:hypothetical protein
MGVDHTQKDLQVQIVRSVRQPYFRERKRERILYLLERELDGRIKTECARMHIHGVQQLCCVCVCARTLSKQHTTHSV